MSDLRPSPYPFLYEPVIRRALEEDLGEAGDLTTDAIVSSDRRAAGNIVARSRGCIAGLHIAAEAFRLLDRTVEIDERAADGAEVEPGRVLAAVRGSARAILSAERTALNLLGRLSGIATATRSLVTAVAGQHARIVCTRKTTPGLRGLEKYAVRAGGGANHRFGLDDAVLIKDNHRAIAGGIVPALDAVRRHVGHMVKIEVEVDTLEQLETALGAGADAVLLDNMSLTDLARAVALARGRAVTEASGGITLETVREVAATGIDLISVGWITHSAPQLDVALDIE
jgi:nicotinate-nucleotide pyrophosphorylase (carboxylating)